MARLATVACLALLGCRTVEPPRPSAPAPSPRPVAPSPVAQFFHGDDERALAPVPVARVQVFSGRPWIGGSCPGTIVFAVERGRSPMPAEWVERLRQEAASHGCDGIQIGFQQGAICEYFETPERIDGYCARCLALHDN
jgi:hypothetical protein